MKRRFIVLFSMLLLFSLAACGNHEEEVKTYDFPVEKEAKPIEDAGESISAYPQAQLEISEEEETMNTIRLYIGGEELSVEWENNESVDALKELVKEKPLEVQMSMYGGFEQVGDLGISLPRHDAQTTTGAGDIVLYSGNQVVIFYGSNSWAYTRLGRVADKSEEEMSELLGNGDVMITLSE